MSNQISDIEDTGKIRIRIKTKQLRETYDWAFMTSRPGDARMLVDIKDVRWMIECIERLNK